MLARRSVFLRQSGIVSSAVLVAWIAVALLASARPALAAFPPAGTDELPVVGEVSVRSRIGQETIALTGTATIQRGDAQLQGGVEVVPAEITALNLQGNSVTGPVTVGESGSLASTGELRALQSSSSYPASSFFNIYATVTAPASPNGSTTLRNYTEAHLVATESLYNWPPFSATYAAVPDPCVPLVSTPNPKDICVTSLSFTVSGGVGGVTELPDIDALAVTDRNPSRHETAMGIAIALAGLAAAGLAGWHARRLFAGRG